VISIQ